MVSKALADVAWGVIGCGDVVEHKSGPPLASAPGSRIAAVMRRDAGRAAAFAARMGVPAWYDDVDALLADPNVNAIYVATPTNSHADLTVRALRSGRPVLVEKPMALDTAEATRMVNAAAALQLPLFVAYYRRTLPRFEAMRALIQSGELGEARGISIIHNRPAHFAPRHAWKVDPEANGGGLFMDTEVHTLDWLDHVFGAPSEVQSTVRRHGNGVAEDLVAYQLTWADGPVANGFYCFGAAPAQDLLTVYGSRATASMGVFDKTPITVTRLDGSVETIERPDPAHVHQHLIERIVDELRGGPPAPSRGIDGVRTVAVVDRIYADWRSVPVRRLASAT
ncbi:MAG: Gfo/Idh/MocA family oxidoreductase [Pseudomonadota bacterium]